MFGLTTQSNPFFQRVLSEEKKFPENTIAEFASIEPKVLQKNLENDQTDSMIKKFDEILSAQLPSEALAKLAELNIQLRLCPPSPDLLEELKIKRNDVADHPFTSAIQYQLSLLDETLFGRPEAEIINTTGELTHSERAAYRAASGESGLTKTKQLAINVSLLVDGNEGRPIRYNIHSLPGPDNLLLVQRYIDDFESGRRRFIFQDCTYTSLECYQMMMLYVIDSFSQRHQYYQLHPGYLPKNEFKNFLANFLEKPVYSGIEVRFSFEYLVCQLETMRDQALSMTSDNIDSVLDDFRKLYYPLQRIGQNITISTGIATEVFSRDCRMKPVPICGAPKQLKKLIESIGKYDASQRGKAINYRVDHLLKILKKPIPQVTDGLFLIGENLKKMEKGGLEPHQEKALRLTCLKILGSLAPYLGGEADNIFYSSLSLTSGLGHTAHNLENFITKMTPNLLEEYPFLESMMRVILALPRYELCDDLINPMLLQGLEAIDKTSKNNQSRDFYRLESLREKLIDYLSDTPHAMKGSWNIIRFINLDIKKLDDKQLAEYPKIHKHIIDLKMILEDLIGNYCDSKKDVVKDPNVALNLMMRIQPYFEQLEKEMIDLRPQNFKVFSLWGRLDSIIYSIRDLCIPFVGPNLAFAKRIDNASRTLLESLEIKASEQASDPKKLLFLESLRSKLQAVLIRENSQPLRDLIGAYEDISGFLDNKRLIADEMFSDCQTALEAIKEIPKMETPYLSRRVYLSKWQLENLKERLSEINAYANEHVNQTPQELASLLSNLRNVVNQEEYFDDRYGESVKGTSVDPVKQCFAVLETTVRLRSALLPYQNQLETEEIHQFLQFLLALEISTSNTLVSELKNGKLNQQEALERLVLTARSQNLITEAQGRALFNPECQFETLAEIRDNLLGAYEGINEMLLNDDAWHEGMEKQRTSPSTFLQFQMGLLNGTVLGAIDRLIQADRIQQTDHGTLKGIPTKLGTVTGKVVIVRDNEKFPEVCHGDILVLQNLPPAHKGYLKASAVISETGGMLSHAAVMLKELSVPCLVGAKDAREYLQDLEGKWVKVTINKKGHHVEEIPQEEAVFKEEDTFDLTTCLNRAFKAQSAIEKHHLHQILSRFTHQKDAELQKLIGQALALTNCADLKPYVWKGKGYALQDLRSLKLQGFQVPEVGVLKAERIFALSGWRQEIEEALNNENFAKINELIMNRPLPGELIKAFEEVWCPLQGDDALQEMIVRSSSGMEDTGTQRMAGLFESVGPVKTFEEGLHAFRTVLASAFSERAINFCSDRSKLFSMDIFVQRYVSKGTHSGVAFSVSDPNNWDNVALQVTHGFGGGVDGTGNPTMLTIDAARNQIIDQHSQELICIPPSTAKKMTKAIKEIETAFEQPVEVEFVYDQKSDAISIVQVAPITRL